MNLLKWRLARRLKIVLFIASLGFSLVVFYADLKLIPDEITLLLPYILIISITTFLIGDKTGLFFSIITIAFWFTAKTEFFVKVSIASDINLVIKSGFIFLQYVLIRYVKKLFAEVESLSLVDELTGLHNRRGFYVLGNHEISKLNRSNQAAALLFIDIDNFKRENDSKGHREGDKILTMFATIMKDSVRHGDIVGRVGGDEFCVLLVGSTKIETLSIGRRLIEQFNAACGAQGWKCSLSIGACLTSKELYLPELISRGDELMYLAKKAGKNQVEYREL